MKRTPLLLLLIPLTALAFAQDKGSLKVATDVGFAPFAFTTPSGELTGFSIDLFDVLAERLGYAEPEVVDVNFASIFAGLYAERYDFILGMVTVTPERAEQMLFSEPYVPTGLSLLANADVAPLAGFEELAGKSVAVNSGSVSDTWVTENAPSYGFEIQRYNKVADAFQAVATNRAFVAMAETPVIRYTASQNPRVAEVLFIDTDRSFAFAFRPEDTALRDEVEAALECLKLDGTLAEIHTKWFKSAPDEGLAAATVYPGFGFPGLPGYDAAEHTAACQ